MEQVVPHGRLFYADGKRMNENQVKGLEMRKGTSEDVLLAQLISTLSDKRRIKTSSHSVGFVFWVKRAQFAQTHIRQGRVHRAQLIHYFLLLTETQYCWGIGASRCRW